MKTIINGMEIEGTPSELKEFMDLCEKPKKVKVEPVKEVKKTIVPPAGIGARGGKNPSNTWNRKGQAICTISVINGQRIQYTSKTQCAKTIGIERHKIDAYLDKGKAISGYFISSKLHP